jgi:type F conjugative transfer system protein TrbI
MNPRRFINFFRSPTGALTLFLVGLALTLIMVNSRRPFDSKGRLATKSASKASAAQLPETVRRNMVPFGTPTPQRKIEAAPIAKSEATPPPLPPLSILAETPPAKLGKVFSEDFAPFGRLVSCELIITVDSSSIQTPIIGLVTEDVFHHGQLIIPAGTEVHGTAQLDHARERIASNGRWTLVWQNGQELAVSGLALDRERNPDTGTWGITDGSAGLRGRLLKTDDLAEVKLFIASLLSGAAEAFTQKQVSPFGSFALPTLQNAGLQGAQSVLDRYAQQILQTIERDGFYVRVPAGKQFYLYITQTIDEQDAKIGGTLASALPAESPSPSPTPPPSLASPNLLGATSISTDSITSTPQPNLIP